MKRLPEGTAALLLMLCCVFWGLSFPLMALVQNGLPGSEAARGATTNAWRYLVAGLLLMACFRRRPDAADWRGGLVIGVFMGGGMFFQIVGLSWVVPSVSGMITSLTVVLAPLAQAFILRRPVARRTWLAAAIAVIGCLVLTQGEGEAAATSLLRPPPFPYAGEIATAIGTCFFTATILAIDRYAPAAHPTRMSALMFLTVAVVNLIASLPFGGHAHYTIAVAGAVLADRTWVLALATLVVVCSIGAFWIMNRAQPSVTPARAAVIYCLEPVFALLFSLALGQEHLTAATILGGSLVIGAALLAAMPARKAGAGGTGEAVRE